jgi:hypothetical protein
MKTVLAIVVGAAALAQGAHAQEAVQWRVQDGGNGHWYARTAVQGAWPEVQAHCVSRGGHLVTITSAPENAFARSLLPGAAAWIGGFQPAGTCEPLCDWRWVTGEPWGYAPWAPGEPNDAGGQDCAQIYTNGFWDDDASPVIKPGIIEWSADCNNDSIVDYGQILIGQLADTNTNGVPDCCEQGTPCLDPDGDGISNPADNCPNTPNPDQLDCNANGVGDACETGYADCNSNSIPDYCDIASGTSADADGNGVPDTCQPDCNLNDLPDAFEIASGLVSDLNADGTPDDCQGARRVWLESPNLGAPSGSAVRLCVFSDLLPSETVVTITVDLRGDLNGQTEWADIVLNNDEPRRFFETDGSICPAVPDRAVITLTREEYNELIDADGRLSVRVVCPATVDGTECKENGLTVVKMSYVGITPAGDCNQNLRLDVVETHDGTAPDCNSNKLPDSCDIASGLSSDCNGNGIPDSCELAEPSNDCNGNGVPDSCDVASGTSADRDGNQLPDECQTVTVPGNYATIQQAIDTAPASVMRIIAVAAGTYAGPIAFNGKPVVVRGISAAQTILEGTSGQQSSVVRFNGGEPAIAALERVTVRGGTSGSPIPSNPSVLVGGGLFGMDSAASVRDCVFENNAAGFGAGAYFLRCSGSVAKCVFRNNTASADGGGVQSNQGTQQFTGVTVQGNFANSRGGGVHLVQGQPTLTSVQVVGNHSNNLIGGLSWYSIGDAAARLQVFNCSVTGNSASVFYGGIGVSDQASSPPSVPTVAMLGTTVCSNLPRPNFAGRYQNLGGNTVCDCVADLLLDGVVNGADLGALLSAWGPCMGACAADFDANGAVDGADLGVLLSAWGVCSN